MIFVMFPRRNQNSDRPPGFRPDARPDGPVRFYTTKEGMKDLQYIGNVPLFAFNGPPKKVLEYLKRHRVMSPGIQSAGNQKDIWLKKYLIMN